MKNISVGTHKLKLDFANGASGVLFSTQADSGRTFEVQVLDEENNVQDITDLSLDFFVGTSEEVTKVSATIKDAVNGIFEINAVSSQFKYAGVHKAQFVLRDATGAKIGTQIYNIHVEESIENGATVGENVIVSFEAVSEAAELLRNSGAVLEESKEVSATLKTDIAKAETIDTTLKTTTKTAEDTNTKAQATNTTLTKAIETANTANANTTNTLNQLTAENDEATLNITDLDEKNKLATTNIADLASSTNTANTSNTNLKTTITNAGTAEQKLKTEIVNAGLENYITLEDIKNKADLGADGKVLPAQLPTTEVYFRDIKNTKGFIKFKLNVPIYAMFCLDINVLDTFHHYKIRVSGYNYITSKQWHTPKVSLLESSLNDVKVYIGYDGDNDLWIALDRLGHFGATINNLLLSYGTEHYDISKIEMIQEQELTGNIQETFNLKKLANVGQLPTQQQITNWNSKQDKLIAGTNITISEDGKTISAIDKDTITTINGKTGAITKADIAALGIPDKDTTYSVATTSANGLMANTDKTKLDGIEANAQKNTITSVQGRTGAVTMTKVDLGLGSVENIGIKILTQAQYDGLSSTEKARIDMLYAISG